MPLKWTLPTFDCYSELRWWYRVSAVLWSRLPVFSGFEPRGFQPSSKSGKGGVGFWAVPLAARMWLAVSSPSALELHTLCTLEWQAFLCEESLREDICELHKYPVTGIQTTETPDLVLFPGIGGDIGLLVPVWICLLREVCFCLGQFAVVGYI